MITRSVQDLPSSERQVLEALLGQHLAPDQQVFVMAYTPNEIPDERTRDAARKALQQTFEAIDRHTLSEGISTEEADAAVNEAMEQIRPRTP